MIRRGVTVKIDGESAVFAPSVWLQDGNLRWSSSRKKVGSALVVVFFERVRGYRATRITWAVVNGLAHTGAIIFDRLEVRLSGKTLYTTDDFGDGPHAVQVRGMLARRHTVGRDARRLQEYAATGAAPASIPAWAESVCADGLWLARGEALQLGPYLLSSPSVVGPSSLDGSHGGWSVAPWHMGPEGWQRHFAAGKMWAEVDMFNTLDRSPIACFGHGTLRPWNPHVPYWPGRASSVIPGFDPDPDPSCSYLPQLEKYEAHAHSHLHRETCAAAMLAKEDAFARWLLVEVYWHDIEMWFDGADSDNVYLKPLSQVQRELQPNSGWREGGRGFAHAVRCFLYAEPYMEPRKAAMWRDRLKKFIRYIALPNGILHRTEGDDTYPVAPACRAREVDLMYPNLIALGLYDIAEKCAYAMRAVNGEHVAASFNPDSWHWSKLQYASPSYYPLYDLLRNESLHLIDLSAPWYSPKEQLISMIWPSTLVG